MANKVRNTSNVFIIDLESNQRLFSPQPERNKKVEKTWQRPSATPKPEKRVYERKPEYRDRDESYDMVSVKSSNSYLARNHLGRARKELQAKIQIKKIEPKTPQKPLLRQSTSTSNYQSSKLIPQRVIDLT